MINPSDAKETFLEVANYHVGFSLLLSFFPKRKKTNASKIAEVATN